MVILTLSNGGESPLRSYEISQNEKWQRYVDQVMASYDKHKVSGDFRKSLRLVKADLIIRGQYTTCGSLYYIIRAELKGRIHVSRK